MRFHTVRFQLQDEHRRCSPLPVELLVSDEGASVLPELRHVCAGYAGVRAQDVLKMHVRGMDGKSEHLRTNCNHYSRTAISHIRITI